MDGSEDYDMGYTPARLVTRSASELFHRPWDGKQSGDRTAVKTKEKKSIKDPFLQKLAELLDKCATTQPGGCDACPNRRGCTRWWGGITDESNHGRLVMTEELFKIHRAEFLGRIKPK